MYTNKNILITGGTGSFGNLFVKRISEKFKPKRLIIYSRDEYKQHEMQKKFNPKKFRNVEHIHFFGYYIGNYPSLKKDKIFKICKLLNKIDI